MRKINKKVRKILRMAYRVPYSNLLSHLTSLLYSFLIILILSESFLGVAPASPPPRPRPAACSRVQPVAMDFGAPRRLQDEPRGRQDVSKMPSFFIVFSLGFLIDLGSIFHANLIQLGFQNQPKSMKKNDAKRPSQVELLF